MSTNVSYCTFWNHDIVDVSLFYWGFQNEGIKPDIVVLAKGIANGFPMAAVVTTEEIAKSLCEKSVTFSTVREFSRIQRKSGIYKILES